jgi:hypothetical protein
MSLTIRAALLLALAIMVVSCGGKSSTSASGSGTAGATSGGVTGGSGQSAGADASGTVDAASDTNECGLPPPGCARKESPEVCGPGFVCDPSHGCTASVCSCDPGVGWGCTADCGGGSCVPVDGGSGPPFDGGTETGPADAAGDVMTCGPPPPGCARSANPEVCIPGYICDPTLGTGNQGDSCTAGNACICTSSGWFCDAVCGGGMCMAVDAATPGAMCPPTQPNVGDACLGPIACSYQGVCGLILMECSTTKSYWAVGQAAKCSGGCPATEPKVGELCMAGGKCSYVSACGGNDIVFCDGNGTVSMIMAGTCPICPSQEPAPLSTCSAPQSCKFTNTCGGSDVATCSNGVWNVLRGDCEM